MGSSGRELNPEQSGDSIEKKRFALKRKRHRLVAMGFETSSKKLEIHLMDRALDHSATQTYILKILKFEYFI